MAYYNNYESEEELIKDWNKLKPEYQQKLYKYVRKMLELQRIEIRLNRSIREFENEINEEISKRDIICSFCGRRQDEIEKMIASPDGSYICNECVEVCKEIIDEELNGENAP